MSKILIIARREFTVTVVRAGFVLTLIAMPLFFVVLPGLLIYLMNSPPGAAGATQGGRIGVVDHANLVHLERAATPSLSPRNGTAPDAGGSKGTLFISYPELDQALNDLASERISVCYVIDRNYPATGEVASYQREGGLFSSLLSRPEDDLDRLLRASLLKDRLDEKAIERVIQPVVIKENSVSKQGEIKPVKSGLDRIGAILLPLGMFILFTMAVLTSSGYLLQSTAEERESRILEVLVSSVRPAELLTGKIVGLAGAGLLQVGAFAAIIVLAGAMFFSNSGLSAGKVLLSVVYAFLGYLLFASLMAGTGMLSDTVQDSTQYALIWAGFSVVPIMLLQQLSSAPDSALSKLLSYFPLTAPGTMILRIVMSTVSPLDAVVPIVGLILGIFLAVIGAAKLFRTASLMYGKGFDPREIARWLRQA